MKLSESPAYAGGRVDRGAPCYGEDNEYVYGELLGMTTAEIKEAGRRGRILGLRLGRHPSSQPFTRQEA